MKEPNVIPIKEPCKSHNAPELPYLAWQAYAKERHDKGDGQTQCKVCGRWYFDDEI